MLFEREGQVLAVLFGEGSERDDDVGNIDPLTVRNLAADFDDRFDAARRHALHAKHQLAIVDQQARIGFGRREQFGMRQMHARRVARRLVGVEHEGLALNQLGGAVLERPDAQLRPLQIDEDRRRAAGLLFERADRGDNFGVAGMIAVAHIDAKGVRPRAVQFGDHLGIGARGTEGRQDANLALAGGKALNHKCSDDYRTLGQCRLDAV